MGGYLLGKMWVKWVVIHCVYQLNMGFWVRVLGIGYGYGNHTHAQTHDFLGAILFEYDNADFI